MVSSLGLRLHDGIEMLNGELSCNVTVHAQYGTVELDQLESNGGLASNVHF